MLSRTSLDTQVTTPTHRYKLSILLSHITTNKLCVQIIIQTQYLLIYLLKLYVHKSVTLKHWKPFYSSWNIALALGLLVFHSSPFQVLT